VCYCETRDAGRLVVTGSNAEQTATTVLGIPCLTMHPNTERPITCEIGVERKYSVRHENC
jgi:UDP-N-acetylglucosamine 2-epimerase